MQSKRRFAKWSRADVLWSIGLFLASQLALAISIETWLPELRDPLFAARAAKLTARTRAQPRPLTIVMLGSSRVRDGFNATELEAQLSRRLSRPLVLYNFGVPAAGPLANLLHFERLMAAGVKPDLLLIEVAPMLMDWVDGEPHEARFIAADRLWKRDIDLLEPYRFPGAKMRREWYQDWLVPCHVHRRAIATRLLPDMLPAAQRIVGDPVDSSGWWPHHLHPPTAAEYSLLIAQAHNEFGPRLRSLQICPAVCRAQRDLLARCRDERIAAMLVWLPETKVFQSWYSPAAERQIRGCLEEWAVEFDVPWIDARDWVADDGFVDSHHLLYAGAVQFTERLDKEVVSPLLRIERSGWEAHLAAVRRGATPAVAKAAADSALDGSHEVREARRGAVAPTGLLR